MLCWWASAWKRDSEAGGMAQVAHSPSEAGVSRLSQMAKGQTGTVERIREAGACAERLAALGFLPGAEVAVAHVAPLGDPISVRMKGQQVSVRRAEAECVEVRVREA